jgi:hypothetical protein
MDSTDFASMFGSEPDVTYGRQAYDAIKHHRAQLGGELFIDKLLRLIKLDSGMFTPAVTNQPDLTYSQPERSTHQNPIKTFGISSKRL